MLTYFFADDGRFTHLVAFLVLLSRAADLGSTWLASPTLRLESNPLVRRLGWRFAFATLLLALLPYYNSAIGVAALTTSFLVAGSNLGRAWVSRALGEAEMEAIALRAVRRSSRGAALGSVVAGAACIALVGAFEMLLSRQTQWGFWFGFGIVIYAGALALYGSLHVRRLFRRAADGAPAAVSAEEREASAVPA